MPGTRVGSSYAIWFFAAIYFCCYAPFTGLTKALSSGLWEGTGDGIPGATILPIATMASLVVMVIFLTVARWWRFATHKRVFGVEIPVPTLWTGLSGLCTSVILTTATLAYTFDGVSIVFVMLLMRGGVLVLAPVTDALLGRQTRWFSWVGLLLSLAALVVAFAEDGGYEITLLCAIDVALYLVAYFVRLRLMTNLAKSDDPDVTRRYFVEEQLMTTPATFLMLAVAALWGQGQFMEQVRQGFLMFDSGLFLEIALIGTFSQLVGIFGTLIFLDKRENTFSVPVNRCSSVLAGVVASVGLAVFLGASMPSSYQLAGAGLVVGAILVLSIAPMLQKRGEREVAPA